MNFELPDLNSSYMATLNNADEIHAYSNGDGTFEVEIIVCVKFGGEEKPTTIKLPRVKFGDFEIMMGGY